MGDCSWHPCVRVKRWQRERSCSFVRFDFFYSSYTFIHNNFLLVKYCFLHILTLLRNNIKYSFTLLFLGTTWWKIYFRKLSITGCLSCAFFSYFEFVVVVVCNLFGEMNFCFLISIHVLLCLFLLFHHWSSPMFFVACIKVLTFFLFFFVSFFFFLSFSPDTGITTIFCYFWCTLWSTCWKSQCTCWTTSRFKFM